MTTLCLKEAFPEGASTEPSETHADVIDLLMAAEAAGLTKPAAPVEFVMPSFPTTARSLDVTKIEGIPDQACSLYALLTRG